MMYTSCSQLGVRKETSGDAKKDFLRCKRFANCSLIYVTSDHRPRGPPPNCNANNDKFVTKTAIAFSVSALSLKFSPRPQTVKTFFWSSPDFREKFCSSAHDELFFCLVFVEVWCKILLWWKIIKLLHTFCLFSFIELFIFFFYKNSARGAKIIFPF